MNLLQQEQIVEDTLTEDTQVELPESDDVVKALNDKAIHTYLRTIIGSNIDVTDDRTVIDDILQDTFIRAIEKKHQYQDGTKIRAWLATIAFNLTMSYHRKRRRSTQIVQSTENIAHILTSNHAKSADQDIITQQSIEEIVNAFNKVTEKEKRVVSMVLGGLSRNDVAEKLGIAKSSVNGIFLKVRKKMQEELKDKYPNLYKTKSIKSRYSSTERLSQN